MRQKVFLLIVLSLLFCFGAQAQDTAVPVNAEDAKPTAIKNGVAVPLEKTQPVRIPRFDTKPQIDGKLDENAWKNAVLFKDFYQIGPGDNIAPSRRTEMWMGYDSKAIYIAVHAYDEPDKVRATFAQRDEVLGDDNFRIFLDTFNDQRRAYILGFNPYGIQQDGIITEGQGTDYSIDILMESKGSITEDGWVLEVAVPFKSLRYQAGKGKMWGFNVWRNIDRFNDEVDSWLPVSRDKTGTLNQIGHITGFEDIDTERTLEIIPSLTLSQAGERIPTMSLAAISNDPMLRDPGRIINRPVNADFGFTAKFGLTPNITLDATINPDFAQVEADEPVITANQRFPIFYSEKRPFFLEGKDIFQTPIQALNTRAIIDPDYAVKLSGKQGRTTFGLLLASDNAPGNYSEEERNDPDVLPDIQRFLDKNAYIGVLRLKRDIGRESSLGFLATSSDFIERHNRLAGIDGRFRLDKQTTFSFQALGTTSRNYFFDADLDKSIYRTGNGSVFHWNLNKSGRHFGYGLSGRGTSRDYRADVGFTTRRDSYSNNANLFYNSEPKPTAKLISWSVSNLSFVIYDGKGRSQGIGNETDLSFNFTKQTYLSVGTSKIYDRIFEEEFGSKRNATRAGVFFGAPERSVNGGSVFASFYTGPSQKYSVDFSISHRWNTFDYDFGAGQRYPRVSPAALLDANAPLDPGAAKSLDIEVEFEYTPVAALETSWSYSRNHFTRSETNRTVFIDNIYSAFAKYQFTRFLYARAVFDYDSLDSRVRGQYLFGWTPNPGTAFYVGYNDTSNYNGFSPFTRHYERGLRLQSRTFFIKTSYLFRRSL
jgi:hypothetical protein